MFDLEKVKMVLFDFDDTLCIHSNHEFCESNKIDYMIEMVKGNRNYWDEKGCLPNIQMKIFVALCNQKNKPLGIISATEMFLSMNFKRMWAEEMYKAKFANYCVSTDEGKLEIMEAICRAYNYEPSEILFVDDYHKNVSNATKLGFQACSPMEIVNYINKISSMSK